MGRFRKTKRREVPVLNTASLPDLIFTILFFFMIVTNMRLVPVNTQFDLPKASELQKLQEKKLVLYIMVGKGVAGEENPTIQADSEFISLNDLPMYLEKRKENVPSYDLKKMTVILKMDKDTPMGLVNDIKGKLRNANLLTIHYSIEKNKNS